MGTYPGGEERGCKVSDLLAFLETHNACPEGIKRAYGFRSLEDAWDRAEPSDLVWLATRPGVLTAAELVAFTRFCAEDAASSAAAFPVPRLREAAANAAASAVGYAEAAVRCAESGRCIAYLAQCGADAAQAASAGSLGVSNRQAHWLRSMVANPFSAKGGAL